MRLRIDFPALREAPFQSVTIIGVGLLGASLGLAMKRHGVARRIIGVGRAGSTSIDKALAISAIDETACDPAVGVRDSDLVILAANVGQFPALLQAIAPGLKSGALVTDVGSTKEQVMKWAAKLLPNTVDFVGSHPMAGSEKRGPENATPDLYTDALCLLCSPKVRGRGPFTGSRTTAAMVKIEDFWQSLGMRTLRIDAQRHDQWVALVSHVPHAMACITAMTAGQKPEAGVAIAGGFIDTTRIAAGDPGMWTDIFLTNRAQVNKTLNSAMRNMKKLQSAIRRSDVAAIHKFLQDAKEEHESLLARRRSL